MHQIRFWLGLRPPKTPLGELTAGAPPDPLAVFKGAYFYGERGEEKWKGRGRKGRDGRTALRISCCKFLATPLLCAVGQWLHHPRFQMQDIDRRVRYLLLLNRNGFGDL